MHIEITFSELIMIYFGPSLSLRRDINLSIYLKEGNNPRTSEKEMQRVQKIMRKIPYQQN